MTYMKDMNWRDQIEYRAKKILEELKAVVDRADPTLFDWPSSLSREQQTNLHTAYTHTRDLIAIIKRGE